MSQVIQERMVNAKTTQESINLARDNYRDIAKRGSVLYFVISELSKINHMYRWSLDYYIQFFNRRLKLAQQSAVLKERVQILIDDLTKNTYKTVCRGLFNKEKLLFSFLITTKIKMS